MALVLVMSAIDLYLTLNQMTSHGMFEGNPLVVFLVESTNSAAGVTLFKALTVAFAVGVILRLRQYVSAELGAWIMTIVLVVLMVQWVRYAAFFSALDPEILDEMRRQAGWVVIG